MATTPITAGPSKSDLSDALFTKDKKIAFTIEGKTVEVCVLQVQAEDGSRESWNLTGYVFNVEGPRPNPSFRAYYHTQRGQGHFEVIG